MGQSRGHKVKALNQKKEEGDVFWMSLEEAKNAISDKYEFLVDRYERPRSHKKPA
jgi:hypothetical protein